MLKKKCELTKSKKKKKRYVGTCGGVCVWDTEMCVYIHMTYICMPGYGYDILYMKYIHIYAKEIESWIELTRWRLKKYLLVTVFKTLKIVI